MTWDSLIVRSPVAGRRVMVHSVRSIAEEANKLRQTEGRPILDDAEWLAELEQMRKEGLISEVVSHGRM